MSFRDDWLAEWVRAAAVLRPRLEKIPEAVGEQFRVYEEIAGRCAQSVVIRLRGDQAQVFLDTPRIAGQDYARWLRLPFPSIYIGLESPLVFRHYLAEEIPAEDQGLEEARRRAVAVAGNYDSKLIEKNAREARDLRMRAAEMPTPELRDEVERASAEMETASLDLLDRREQLDAIIQVAGMEEGILRYGRDHNPPVKGVLLYEDAYPRPILTHEAAYRSGDVSEASAPVETIRRLCIVFFMPHPQDALALHSANLQIGTDGQLHTGRVGFWRTRMRMIDWAVHTVNFLSSPSVKLVRQEPDAALQKARARKGKPPLPGWYEIAYAKHIQDYSGRKIAEGKAWEHGYRYDVRGHFKHFAKGIMAGRVIWCPPHQRGLKHELFKPKGYVTELAR